MGSFSQKFGGCVTQFAQDKALKSSASGALTFDERVVLHRVVGFRSRTNAAHTRQSRPESGLGFHVKVLNDFEVNSLFVWTRRLSGEVAAATSVRDVVGRVT